MAVKYQPDKNRNNKSAEEKFKEFNEVNEVLRNAEKRKNMMSWVNWNITSNQGPYQLI